MIRYIVLRQGKYKVSASDETGGNGNLSDNQKDTIDRVLAHYGGHDAQWLSQLTHMEDPWIKAKEGNRTYIFMGSIFLCIKLYHVKT